MNQGMTNDGIRYKINQQSLNSLLQNLDNLFYIYWEDGQQIQDCSKQLSKRNKIFDEKDFQINQPNSMINSQFLHFFQPKSVNLHLFNLNDNKFQHQKIALNINFKIPRWHRSCVTPNCDIILTGGVSYELTDHKLNSTYKYDFHNKTLVSQSNMITPRSGHGLIYLNNYIYAVGGLSNENQFTKLCEKFSISEGTWSPICSLNYQSNNPCICTFQNKFIFKFGGKIDDNNLNNNIEKYIPDLNIWENIYFNFDTLDQSVFKLLSSSAGLQINHNQIIVFGGTYENYQDKSNRSFLLQIEQQNSNCSYTIKQYSQKNLPSAEGFWGNVPIIFQNTLYSLQNVSSANDPNIVYLDRKNIIKFDSNKWELLN